MGCWVVRSQLGTEQVWAWPCGQGVGVVCLTQPPAAWAVVGCVRVPQVYLDRPFLYMIIDAASGLPLFIGTVSSL